MRKDNRQSIRTSCHIVHDYKSKQFGHNLGATGFRIGTLIVQSLLQVWRCKKWTVLSGIKPATLWSKPRFVAPLANDDSGLVSSALVKLLSGGGYAQGPRGCFSWGLEWTRPTPCTPSAQTTRPHCLDYCSSLASPAPITKLRLWAWLY